MQECKSCDQNHDACLGHSQSGNPCGRRPKKSEQKCWHCLKTETAKDYTDDFTHLQFFEKKEEPDTRDFDKIAERFYNAYERTYGNISAASEYAGISRQTYYLWSKSKLPHHICFRQKLKALRPVERQVDFLEAKLMERAAAGDITAIIFGLKTKGRERGYGERPVSEQLSDIEKADVIKGMIERQAQENGVSFQQQFRDYLEIYGPKLKPEIKARLLSDFEN